MIDKSLDLINNFFSDMKSNQELNIESTNNLHDFWPAPQKETNFIEGFAGAVYVFSLTQSKGKAKSGRVLKVGKVGPNSNPRFRYQHYHVTSARSTLAGAIINNPILWNYIGYSSDSIEIGKWIKENTDRDNFYFKSKKLVDFFEVYAKALLGPVFEGSLSSKT